MALPPNTRPVPTPEAPTPNSEIPELSNRIARSAIAVIDTIVQRGGFRGEELTTIGQLRDQCVQMTAMVEQEQLDGN
jgi:hypothetical protein